MKVDTGLESTIRTRLGIPPDAVKVIVLGETSHWDPNWLYTSEEYYDRRIRKIIQEAIEALETEPRRVFSIESLFFLRRYWDREPSKRATIRALVNDGRIRLSGTGLTTPDTVLPDAEPIIRDYLIGQEWLREHGMNAEPALAYLPDDFGHSPALPSILRGLGYDKVGITRIDGMYFVATDYRKRSSFPLEGSSAQALLEEYKTCDFIWRGPDGSEVLCHWNAFTYFQGDMLAHLGIIRWMGVTWGMPWRSGHHITRRIKGFVNQLSPLSRTPYMFCPIGCDFNAPIRGLLKLLDDYNQREYQKYGVYAVNASMEDYLELVDCWRTSLPVLDLDPNPYWMGFYATRPDIKVRCNRIARKLMLAEKLATVASVDIWGASSGGLGPDSETQRELNESWDLLAVSNHHDFITGTATDRVWEVEQGPWLKEAESLVDDVLSRVVPNAVPIAINDADDEYWRWEHNDGVIHISSLYYEAEMRENSGWCFTKLSLRDQGRQILMGPGNDIVFYDDSGGLWRMGHEYKGGVFREIDCASKHPAIATASEQSGLLEVKVNFELGGNEFVRWIWFRKGNPIIRMRISGAAPRRRTVTCRFPIDMKVKEILMDVPGGVVHRPAFKLFDPTFWPARSFAYVEDLAEHEGFCAFLGGPACVCFRLKGEIEWVVLRNAPKETAYRILPLLAHPATGTDTNKHSIDYAIWVAAPGEFKGFHPPWGVRKVLGESWLTRRGAGLDEVAEGYVTTDDPDVVVRAIKHAERGHGLIVRLAAYGPIDRNIALKCPSVRIRKAFLCDARERDKEEISVAEGGVIVPVNSAIVSVRILS